MDLKKISKNLKFVKFRGEKQIKVGSILELNTSELHLVGNVNESLGVCDDCRDFAMSDIVSISHIKQALKKY